MNGASAVIDSIRTVKTVLNLTMLHLAATHGKRLVQYRSQKT